MYVKYVVCMFIYFCIGAKVGEYYIKILKNPYVGVLYLYANLIFSAKCKQRKKLEIYQTK